MALTKSFMKRYLSAALQVRSYSAPADRTVPAAKQKYVPTSGTYPKGFLAGSSHAGVKASNTQYDDIAMVVSENLCAAGAVFTRNLFKAAPVTASKYIIYHRSNLGIRGVVVNSGCANAVTGAAGLEDAHAMARSTDACFGEVNDAEVSSTLVMSTGVIGQKLPIDKITDAIPKAHAALGSDHEDWMSAAKAICTTDTFPKLLSRTFTLPSHPEVQYSIAGMTKGAGMIHPNMGTLLGIICTDVKISQKDIAKMLRQANGKSFNAITIDGDTSTNDTVALLANGAAAPADAVELSLPPGKGTRYVEGSDTAAFMEVLKTFMADLAKLVVRDGEGATKFVTVRVQSDAGPQKLAKRAAQSIATSSLVKTALYGKDANWGRILCAIGYADGIMSGTHYVPKDAEERKTLGLAMNKIPAQTSVSFIPTDGSAELKLLVRGEPQAVDEERAKEILEMEDLEILVNLADRDYVAGQVVRASSEAVVWTCDFSHEYVTINGDYRT